MLEVMSDEGSRCKGWNSPPVEIEVADNSVTKVPDSGPPPLELVKVEWEVEITPL